MSDVSSTARRYDFDWLRVGVVLLLVRFHSALVLDVNPGRVIYIRDVVHSEFLK
jgi:hypothetical protein